jgi:hypothetical protein
MVVVGYYSARMGNLRGGKCSHIIRAAIGVTQLASATKALLRCSNLAEGIVRQTICRLMQLPQCNRRGMGLRVLQIDQT